MPSAPLLTEPSLSVPDLLKDWHAGLTTREQVIAALTALSSGSALRDVLRTLAAAPAGPVLRQTGPSGTEDWRQELLSCQARAWPAPEAAGLLVGPTALLLSDGAQAVILDQAGTRRLPSGVALSLLLLAQTIVMADDALDAQEIDGLRRCRVQASSSSLSEITPIH